MKILVVYNTKYGNTKLVAEKIVEGIGSVGGVEPAISDVQEVEIETIADYDAILIGSPNHLGRPARGISKFIDNLAKLDLKTKRAAVFDTYLGGDFEKVVKKMEKRISEKVPDLRLITSGLSIKVKGMKGPIVAEELPKCKDFGKIIANQLKA